MKDLILIEVEVDGKLVERVRSITAPVAGDVMSINNEYAVDIIKRHWVVDQSPSGRKELRCILECKKQ